MSAPPAGTPVGLELPAKDVARGSAFYSAVFGWTFSPSRHGLPAEKLLVFSVPGGIFPVGGVLRKVDDIPVSAGLTKVYVYVNDIVEAQKAIEKAGGKLVGKVLPDGALGQFQYVEDSEGNPLAIYSYSKN